MKFDKGENKTQNHDNAKSAHYITSYFRTPVARPIISAMIKTTITKTTPAMPYVSLVSFQHRRPKRTKTNNIIKLTPPPFYFEK